MLTTVATLVIVLGLMVSLARDVRNRSADRVTKDLLRKLDKMMADYYDRYDDLTPFVKPPITPLIAEGAKPEEPVLERAAAVNNLDLSRLFRTQADPREPSPTFYDAWGHPIVFMRSQHPAIGMAANDNFFFLSPGPDGRFLTREDNLYSYEEGER